MRKIISLLSIVIGLTSCQHSVNDQDLRQISKPIDHQIHFLIAGLPHQKYASQELDYLQEESKNWQVSVGVGISSGHGIGGPGFPICPQTRHALKGQFYGTLEQFIDPIFYIFEEYGIKKNLIKIATDYQKPQNKTILLIIDIQSSAIIDTQPSTTVGIGLGGRKEHTGGAIGATYGDRSWCHAEITGTITIVTKNNRSKRFDLEAQGRDVKKERENAAKVAYQSASEQFAREILYRFYKYKE
jgi:hypothetical protein